MAITYPLSLPTSVGIANIELTANNAVAISRSPFTFSQQVFTYSGQMWTASVSIPPVLREYSAEWKAMLTALKGQTGTFLLGDPDYATPRGTISSALVTGSIGDETVTVSMTGSLLAGDYIQLGSGASAKLHQVLVDQSGSGSLEIWPALRANYTDATATFDNAKGVFRLSTNQTSWSINESSIYGISFDCMEAL